ncbi:hypothetical protein NDU88_004760 [Pleurodeles waltl]|uniref:Uncharacterized protein n=1 Tax=Pleurodeles waltl TaxID=8319 RepID=A0AAV7T919_PLEWA|nr:hypothetical protein NDU88_004760 [Pleurodeles waltl]
MRVEAGGAPHRLRQSPQLCGYPRRQPVRPHTVRVWSTTFGRSRGWSPQSAARLRPPEGPPKKGGPQDLSRPARPLAPGQAKPQRAPRAGGGVEVSLAPACGPQSQLGPQTHPVFFSPGSASRGSTGLPCSAPPGRARPSVPSKPAQRLSFLGPPASPLPGGQGPQRRHQAQPAGHRLSRGLVRSSSTLAGAPRLSPRPHAAAQVGSASLPPPRGGPVVRAPHAEEATAGAPGLGSRPCTSKGRRHPTSGPEGRPTALHLPKVPWSRCTGLTLLPPPRDRPVRPRHQPNQQRHSRQPDNRGAGSGPARASGSRQISFAGAIGF